jgi:hypothetical protein
MHGLAMASLQSAELGPPLAHLSNLQESEESGFTLRRSSEYIGFILVEDVGRIGHVSDRSTKWMHVIV